jgi:hypothetical protein
MPCKTDVAVAHATGIDTGKNTLHMIGLDEKGAIVLREKVSRNRIAARLVNVPSCLIGIEARMATHYVARELLCTRYAGLCQAVPSEPIMRSVFSIDTNRVGDGDICLAGHGGALLVLFKPRTKSVSR